MALSTKIRFFAGCLAIVLVGVSVYAARIYWCSRQLDTPIFQDGDLGGQVDTVLAKLGKPTIRIQTRGKFLAADESMRDLFLPSDLAKLRERPIEVLVWEQRCLGSTTRQFAVIVEPESRMILAVGGASSFYAPVYFGGLIMNEQAGWQSTEPR